MIAQNFVLVTHFFSLIKKIITGCGQKPPRLFFCLTLSCADNDKKPSRYDLAVSAI